MGKKNRPVRRRHRVTLSGKTKAYLNWFLDKFNDAAVAAYALLTGEKWIVAAKGTATIPMIAAIFMASLLLVFVWFLIGLYKGHLEENYEST